MNFTHIKYKSRRINLDIWKQKLKDYISMKNNLFWKIAGRALLQYNCD